MPKFALANDLWIGKLPECFRGLSEGALLLLPIARCHRHPAQVHKVLHKCR